MPARIVAATVLSATMLLTACTGRPDATPARGEGPRTTSVPVAQTPAGRQCLVGLTASDAQFSMLPDRYPAPGCSNVNTVQVSSLAADGGTVMVGNIGALTCEVSTAFAGWVRYGADRAARSVLGSPLRSVETMGSYNCRNVAGTSRLSAHGTASAVDIGAFVLQDGRRITVLAGWNGGTPAEQEFMRTVQRSACRRFATVLSPEYNAAHRDHLHLEGVASGGSFCR
ncbi:extensin [Croceibacterium mercuriale]|uniref:Extensin n=1 Tax=Croceibacterium mercuriale TaxID=1572751 RepID=A0A0B2BZP1_9SPHN|nr:extensin family protein [Croceibacterium mercuriale]KHL25330.1 extensin [Croceibacterium mercuriale]